MVIVRPAPVRAFSFPSAKLAIAYQMFEFTAQRSPAKNQSQELGGPPSTFEYGAANTADMPYYQNGARDGYASTKVVWIAVEPIQMLLAAERAEARSQ